ncbi:MAG: hypothetical protein KF718_09555 [Polyangiaceae bacterium]|nr:hypothetical protein [Polyangiaceae bacterium]
MTTDRGLASSPGAPPRTERLEQALDAVPEIGLSVTPGAPPAPPRANATM